MDGVNKTANTGAIFQRLLMDIEHLDLGKAWPLHCLQPSCSTALVVLVSCVTGKLESLHSPRVRQTVGISKHLCGAATGKSSPLRQCDFP